MQKIMMVDGDFRKYKVDIFYLEGSVLYWVRNGDNLVIEADVTAQEAAETASKFDKPLRIFTGLRRRQLRRG